MLGKGCSTELHFQLLKLPFMWGGVQQTVCGGEDNNGIHLDILFC